MLMAILEDSAFRKRYHVPYTKRWTVRALAYNEQGELAFLRIRGSDSFGKRDHLETIGGGVENDESLEEALHREVLEEIGYECEIIEELGVIVDHYNLLNRETISTYFIVRLKEFVGETHRHDDELELIAGLEFYNEKDALHMLQSYPKRTVNELVQRRDYYALKHYMKQKEKCEKETKVI